jgi:steroid delta-isomerase-like uncharacterized protein
MLDTSNQDSTIEQNRELGRAFFAAQDRLRGGPDPDLCAPGYRAHLGGNPPVDRDGHETFARAFYTAFPDMRHDVEVAAVDATAVTVRFTIHGTHREPFFGIPATGKSVRVVANVILRVSEGRVAELFGVFDEAGMLRQLGVLPS